MKAYIFRTIIGFFLISSIPSITNAQTPTEASVKINGEVAAPLVFRASDMMQFERTEVIRKDRDNKNHTFSGVTLYHLLVKAGATMGKDLHGENLTKYALAEASDGYQVVFALAELDPEFTEKLVILADRMDGRPLPIADGPFRIIVSDEKRPARCVKQVTSIKVIFAK